jgi:cytochrome b subunit of formate dehydrogenase
MKNILFSIILSLTSFFIINTNFAVAQSNGDCLTCHSDKSMTMEKGGKQISISVDEAVIKKSAHQKLRCISCHKGFNADNIPHKEQIEPINCLTCHNDAISKHAFHPQLAKSLEAREQPDVSCKDCHGNHNIVSSKVPGSKFHESKITDSCTECHIDIREKFNESAHGKALTGNIIGAPNCLTCHRHAVSNLAGIRDSLKYKIEQEKVCLSCHLDNPDVKAKTSPSAGFIAAYEKSVHGAALQKGNTEAANCVDCHGSHEMKKGLEPTALINRMHLPETCAKCHSSIAQEYEESIHGVAVKRGVKDAPVCTDCHGEHNILRPSDPTSRVAAANISVQVCSPCHSSIKLSQKYGLASDRFKTFSDSYHGLATEAGSVQVANCASCHGVHNIKPSSDSTSMISKANLVATCGKCHPGANERFTIGSVHSTSENKDEPLLYWIATIYLVLIIGTIGGMFIHNLLDFIKKSKRKLMIRRGLIPEEHHGTRMYVRMTLNERMQHAILLISFIILVLTGFALKFPDAWWVVPIRSISPIMFEVRSYVHRIAAVVMVVGSLYHLYYIFFVPRGKQLLRDMLPVPKDVTESIGVFKYYFGLSSNKPKFGRFSYIEKAEYWALIWGTVVMAVTGFILWLDNTFLGLLTKLGWDAARTIHYYEAWLATLAIIVWHFYFVIFNPDVYPINLAFWKGTLTEEEMMDEHPLELEEIKKSELIKELKGEASIEAVYKSEEVLKQ